MAGSMIHLIIPLPELVVFPDSPLGVVTAQPSIDNLRAAESYSSLPSAVSLAGLANRALCTLVVPLLARVA